MNENIKMLLPDLDQRMMLKTIIEFEYSECFDVIYRLHQIVPDDGNYCVINDQIEFMSQQLDLIAEIYFRLFSEKIERGNLEVE